MNRVSERRQRIAVRYAIGALDAKETSSYIAHHLALVIQRGERSLPQAASQRRLAE